MDYKNSGTENGTAEKKPQSGNFVVKSTQRYYLLRFQQKKNPIKKQKTLFERLKSTAYISRVNVKTGYKLLAAFALHIIIGYNAELVSDWKQSSAGPVNNALTKKQGKQRKRMQARKETNV